VLAIYESSFKLDMRIYLGNTTSGADGLAFALAGDRPTETKSGGASLGVWGVPEMSGGNPTQVATTGLPNSFVIVVDTKKSVDPLKSGMDKKVEYGGWNPS
ncbi:MAG TPA: hypothetical protein DCL56_02265, partial [Lactobacillus sp.]|nr:hypothetical protein [Lactobacillus sp.]